MASFKNNGLYLPKVTPSSITTPASGRTNIFFNETADEVWVAKDDGTKEVLFDLENIDLNNINTSETDTTLVLRPDGSGGLAFGSEVDGAATFNFDQTYDLDPNNETETVNISMPWSDYIAGLRVQYLFNDDLKEASGYSIVVRGVTVAENEPELDPSHMTISTSGTTLTVHVNGSISGERLSRIRVWATELGNH